MYIPLIKNWNDPRYPKHANPVIVVIFKAGRGVRMLKGTCDLNCGNGTNVNRQEKKKILVSKPE